MIMKYHEISPTGALNLFLVWLFLSPHAFWFLGWLSKKNHPKKNWSVVSTPLKIWVKMGIFPNFRGENKKYLSCHHPEKDARHRSVLFGKEGVWKRRWPFLLRPWGFFLESSVACWKFNPYGLVCVEVNLSTQSGVQRNIAPGTRKKRDKQHTAFLCFFWWNIMKKWCKMSVDPGVDIKSKMIATPEMIWGNLLTSQLLLIAHLPHAPTGPARTCCLEAALEDRSGTCPNKRKH